MATLCVFKYFSKKFFGWANFFLRQFGNTVTDDQNDQNMS